MSVRKKSRRKLGLHSERDRGKTKEDRSEGRKKVMRKKREKSDHLRPETEKGSECDRANK